MQPDRRGACVRIEICMDTNVEILEWMTRTREAQGLSGTVSFDPELHAMTLAAVERVRRAEPQQRDERAPAA